MADMGVPTAERICEEVKKRVKAQRVTDPTQIFEMLRETVAEMIAGDEELHVRTKPSIILVIGVNGVGKTTTIGKIASRLRQEGKKVLLAAADTFRAAAIEQLEVWAERSGSEIVKHPEGSDPAAVVFDAIAAAKSRGADVVICDTAGRLHNKKNLMDELGENQPHHRPRVARCGQGSPAGAGRHNGAERCQPGAGVPERCGS